VYAINDGQELWNAVETEMFLTGDEAYKECDLRNELDALLSVKDVEAMSKNIDEILTGAGGESFDPQAFVDKLLGKDA
jgi:hypothetical protein